MESYSRAAMERAMKVQEVILRAAAKKITWWQAAEIIGISDRQMRRWRERYEEFGFRGLFDRRRGKPIAEAGADGGGGASAAAVPGEVLRSQRAALSREAARTSIGIELSYTWVKGALQGAGLVAKRPQARGASTSGDRDDRCRGCCCTSMAASIAGFRTIAGTTCW